MLVLGEFGVFEEAARRFRTFVIAFSGGKDSTAAAILFYKWARERGVVENRVVLLHNDTLSEIPEVELWADHFARQFKAKMRELGTDVDVVWATPAAADSWYWRVFVRGYPAPTFNFRWCVKLLKIEPTLGALKRYDNYVLVVGSRDEESGARARSMKARFGACAGGGSCLGAYFTSTNDIPKIAPIRFWTYDMVWSFLRAQKDFNVKPLEELYRGLAAGGSIGGRYGCWHCTLVRVQAANYSRPEYLYAEAVRTIYRALSDAPEFRERKASGYSGLGPLNAHARAVIYHAIKAAEELAGKKIFYGLDRAAVYGYTLRQIFYEIEPEKADAVIRRADPTDRRIPIAELRRLDKTALETLERRFNDKTVLQVLDRVKSYV